MDNVALEGLATIDLTIGGLWMRGLRRQRGPLLIGGMSLNIMAILQCRAGR